jgi:hypothetical protein
MIGNLVLKQVCFTNKNRWDKIGRQFGILKQATIPTDSQM